MRVLLTIFVVTWKLFFSRSTSVHSASGASRLCAIQIYYWHWHWHLCTCWLLSLWAPASMCKRGKCCKAFCALLVTAKRSVDELFRPMRYFHNLSSASLGPTDGLSSLQTHNLPTPGKIPRVPMALSFYLSPLSFFSVLCVRFIW